jgi:signal transduction histidine kinase
MAGARIARDVERELLLYGRVVGLAAERGGTEQDEQRGVVLRDLRDRLEEAEAQSGNSFEKQTLEELAFRTEAYFEERSRLARAGVPLGDALVQTHLQFEGALVQAAELTAINRTEAAAARAKASLWDDAWHVVSIAVIVVLVLLVVVLGQGARSQIYLPLSVLQQSIERFAEGDERACAEGIGPVEIRALAGAFNDMSRAIVRKREEQFAVLAAVAHDIRNPLAAVKMAMEAIGRGGPPSEQRLLRTLDLVKRQIDRLDRMAGDLLDAARIQAGHIELSKKPCDLGPIVHEATELYASISTLHHISFVPPDEPLVGELDEARIAQVLDNILGNAIKYSPSGGEIRVVVVREGDEAVVSISDEGIGLAPDELDRIFEPFHRAASTSKVVSGGVGLGLSAAKKIIEAHGGSIEVESRQGEGSTFRLRLPLHGPNIAPGRSQAVDL